MENSINLEKQYSHYTNLLLSGTLAFDVPILEDGKESNKFKTIKITGESVKLSVDEYTLHFITQRI